MTETSSVPQTSADTEADASRSAAPGSWAQRVRLVTGLILFAFALSHFANHAMGLISLHVMEAAADVRRAIWQSLPGTVLLYGSFAVHMGLALLKTVRRRTWRMPANEAMQLMLGLIIPIMLIDHVVGTRLIDELFGSSDIYQSVLSRLWPGVAVWQSVLLLIVWGHAVIGLYFWLRMKPWFPRFAPLLLCLAVLIPVLALAGWISAARRMVLAGEIEPDLSREAVLWSTPVILYGRWLLIALTAGVVLTSLAISFGVFDRARIAVTYPGARVVRARPGQTLLEISRENAIPHTAVCGGRARCSTCRTRVTAGLERLPQIQPAEAAVLKRINAEPNVRLACQLRPRSNCSVQPLFPATLAPQAPVADDSYRWGTEQSIAVLFVDIRGFTALSERRLPFDVVFILNEYLSTMSRQVTDNGGIVDKFIGDSVMALFGISTGPARGSRDALAAAAAMMESMPTLNQRLHDQLSETLRIGIGVHAGPAILGRVGVGAASGGITALGDTVNTASRLEGATKEFGAMLAVSEEAATLAGVDTSAWHAESISVRGRETPVCVYPINAAEKVRSALERRAAA